MRYGIVDIQQLEPETFAPLLQAEMQAWNDDLRWDFTPSARQIEICLEERRLSGYALTQNGDVRGYCFSFCDGNKALIGDLFIDSVPGGHRYGQELLARVIDSLMNKPGLQRIETQLPHFTVQQLDPCFRSRCFATYARRFMAVPLINRDRRLQVSQGKESEKEARGFLQLKDFLLQPWERKFDSEAAELIRSSYRNHVDTVINDQYSTVEGTHHLIRNIVQNRGCGEYLPWASKVAVHRQTRKLAAVLALTAVREGTAHIPQVAVAAEFQGNGLGTFMMEVSFEQLAMRHFREVSLTVTELNSGAVRLYERLGFETFRIFGAYVWQRVGLNSDPLPTSAWPSTSL